MLRVVLSSLVLAGAEAECLEKGIAYANGDMAQPNGAYLPSAAMCQQSCEANSLCQKFTFKPKSSPPGACFLVYSGDIKQTADSTAISGTRSCQVSASITADPLLPPIVGQPGVASAPATITDQMAGAVTDTENQLRGAVASASDSASAQAQQLTDTLADATAKDDATAISRAWTHTFDAYAKASPKPTPDVALADQPAGDTSLSMSWSQTFGKMLDSQGAAAVATLHGTIASACLKPKVAYKNAALPSPPTWTPSAAECKKSCEASATCEVFTWKEETRCPPVAAG
ncbi:unnamed protein product [Effrenium voratum]|nr:unnamed protein product [Effrenium voratum]